MARNEQFTFCQFIEICPLQANKCGIVSIQYIQFLNELKIDPSIFIKKLQFSPLVLQRPGNVIA